MKISKQKSVFIIISTFLICLFLAIIEHAFDINYLIKTSSKILLFLSIIFLTSYIFKNFKIKDILSLKNITKKEWIHIMILGIGSASIVLISFLVFKPFIDISMIEKDLVERLGITSTLFIFVGLYVSFGNSFLEEIFFRGFIYFNLPKKLAYIYSPLLFASYHIPMIMFWFEPIFVILCFIGLWVIGFVFHKVNEKNHTIWSSWIIHICADIMIILIGCYIFYL